MLPPFSRSRSQTRQQTASFAVDLTTQDSILPSLQSLSRRSHQQGAQLHTHEPPSAGQQETVTSITVPSWISLSALPLRSTVQTDYRLSDSTTRSPLLHSAFISGELMGFSHHSIFQCLPHDTCTSSSKDSRRHHGNHCEFHQSLLFLKTVATITSYTTRTRHEPFVFATNTASRHGSETKRHQTIATKCNGKNRKALMQCQSNNPHYSLPSRFRSTQIGQSNVLYRHNQQPFLE